MIVSDRFQFVFVHNPKAAGTSIRRRLAPLDDAAPAFWSFGFSVKLGRRIDRAHIPLADLERAYPEAFEKLRAYRSFVFVRNPYERVVSSFAEWCVRTGRKRLLARKDRARERFGEYVEALDPARVRSHPTWIHACPQHLYVFHRGQQICGRIGRVEQADVDYRAIAAWIGLEAPATLDHHNDAHARTDRIAGQAAGERAAAFDWFDAASARRVAEFYAADFETFAYSRAAP